MSALIRIGQVLLLLLVVVGATLTHVFAYKNGTINMMKHIRDVGPQNLPLTSEPLRRFYTGIKFLDERLTVLACIFWPLLDGNYPSLSLHAVFFAGQVGGVWGLMMVEGMRSGNRGRMVSYIVVLGLLLQNTAYAIVMPLLLAIDLSRSPTISRNLTNVLPKSPAETISIPLSLTLGYLIPMIGFAIPAPSWISFDRLQIIMSAWQAFPIWVSLFQQVFKRTLPIFFSRLQPSQSNAIWSLRVAYSFSLGLMVVSRIVAFTVSFAATFFPMVFSGSYAESFSFWSVYVPATISSATQVSSIGEGFFLLLQYDELVGSASVLVWATLLWISGSNSYSFAQRITAFVQWSLLLLLTGSAGCALVLLWLRDEQLIKRSRVAASKSN